MEEQSKSPYYFSVRHDMIDLMPPEVKSVLEVGCGGGKTGEELRRKGIEEIVGIELIDEVASQGAHSYRAIHIGDVEMMDLPYGAGHFDCALYGDVLEHLKDPWGVISRHNRFVRKGGMIVVSIPNVRHYRIIKNLALKGRWEYQNDGILDRTHLRFFTLESVRTMLGDAGYEIATVLKKPSGVGWIKVLNTLIGNRLIDLLVRQYIISARKIREVG